MNVVETNDTSDAPDAQTLMAAVIRLMAKCADQPEVMPIRTLLVLLRQLRSHPELSRQPAVLAGLAEAHALWVTRLGQIAADTSRRTATECDAPVDYSVH